MRPPPPPSLPGAPHPSPLTPQPSPLTPQPGEVTGAGALATLTGWGKIYDGSSAISPTLHMVADLPTITDGECNAVWEGVVPGPGPARGGVLCVDTKGGHGSCNVGDGFLGSVSLPMLCLVHLLNPRGTRAGP